MSVKERIIAIRLMDKVNANPAAAEKLGITVGIGSGALSNIGSKSKKS